MGITKVMILEEVNQIVNISGFNSVTYIKIAKVLNTTRENIHHHFKTKENLEIEYMDYLYTYLEDYSNNIINLELPIDKTIDKYLEMYNQHSKSYASCPLVSLLADFKQLSPRTQISLRKLLELEFIIFTNIIKKHIKIDNNDAKIERIVKQINISIKGAILYEKSSLSFFPMIKREIKDLLFMHLKLVDSYKE